MTQEPERLTTRSWMMVGTLILFVPLLAVVLSVVKKSGHQAVPVDVLNMAGVKFEPQRSGVSAALADARFPEENWDPKVLSVFEEGPRLLPADSNFKVVPPPANTSAVAEAGLDVLRRYAETLRTPEQLALIEAEHNMNEIYEPFDKAGMFVSASNKATVDLIGMAQFDVSYFVVKYKREFMRVRPDTLAPELKTVVENPGHPAYPSGHAAQGYMAALVLSLVDPAHEAAYKALGNDIGLRREIAGVHYPSDSIAGRRLAQAVLDKLVEVSAFKAQLEKAKASFVPASEESIASYKSVDASVAAAGAAAE